MNIAGEGGQILDAGDVLFPVEDALVEMRDAPAQGNVVVEELAQLGSSLARVGVAPSAEGHQYLLLLVESHIAVHHGREANGSQALYLATVLLQDISAKVDVAVLQAFPDKVDAVCPQAVNKLVLPFESTLSNRLVVLVNKDRLYAGRAKLNAEDGFPAFNYLFSCHLTSVLYSTYNTPRRCVASA